ncbi:thiamine pyrophosphate-dependent enzyme [Umezawaea tangerina]|uniref:Acetolactate synthase-1/2/3 large subunit n=1 Tax=Umezawaea tangerina TaxID=84725 RepID=A0A2T0SK29_9PSEU|nr:thiamine pyrophosphate-dependent enzyme [Umezawaea tangerina]PRY33766.1 acetolactate synthase-1/2/3 large subunit [Umezawaea tangerina]
MSERTGGDVVAETLAALGARTVFGPLALGPFDAVRRSGLRHVSGLNTAAMADGHARSGGEVTALLVPGDAGDLVESTPVVAIGCRAGGEVVGSAAEIPAVLTRAWDDAATAPFGPVRVEIPEHVLLGRTAVPPVPAIVPCPRSVVPDADLIALAAKLLDDALRPVVLAGGGVVRGDARAELLALAEKLRAPVLTTFGGRGAFPVEHPLSAGSWLGDPRTTRFLADADVVLVVGSGQDVPHRIRIDADPARLDQRALGVHGEARFALADLADAVAARPADGVAEGEVRALLDLVGEPEPALLTAIRASLPDHSPTYWDRTPLGELVWSTWDPRDSEAVNGSPDGLGYALPAALGAAAALGDHVPVLAVSGGEGAALGLAELSAARRHGLRVTWLVVDGGSDVVALADAFGVPTAASTAATVGEDLGDAFAQAGPHVVVLRPT